MKPIVSALLCGLVAYNACADAPPPPPDPAQVKFQWGVKIPLRDGVKLNATVYTPRDQKAPAPCVFTLTPYISQSYHDRGMYFASHGYPFLTVDVRGRGNSEGQFRPLIQEARDGHDVVEWLAPTAVLQRQGHDVGRLVRGLQPVGDGQGVPAASRDDRAGRLAVCGHRFSDARQCPVAVQPAMADVHQRSRVAGPHFRRRQLLAREEPRVVRDRHAVQAIRRAGRQSLRDLPGMDGAPGDGRVLGQLQPHG